MKMTCKREKNPNFWKHISPSIVPFENKIFAPSERESASVTEGTKIIYKPVFPKIEQLITDPKEIKQETDFSYENEILQHSCTCLKNVFFQENQLLQVERKVNHDVCPCKQVLSVVKGVPFCDKAIVQCVCHFEPSEKIVENFLPLNVLEIEYNNKVIIEVKPKLEGNETNTHLVLKLPRINETIEFLSNLSLRPACRNSYLFKTPVKLKRLGKLRKNIRKCL